MDALVFNLQAVAQKVSDAIDTKMGYPKPGVDVGGGIHCSPAQSVTVRHSDVVKHPTLTQWAYRLPDAVVKARILEVQADAQARIDAGQPQAGDNLIVAAAAVVLDATWTTVVSP